MRLRNGRSYLKSILSVVFLFVCFSLNGVGTVDASEKTYQHLVMERETIWTNSLFLYPDKIIVKTYNHKKGSWLPEFERTILPPLTL